ncbi:MAG: hypothetical protein HGB26_00500 [Desulfobulbaceae bacterium]|nr:hypothetical protein [Desulfobulbaceae bacterium]
MIIRPRLNDFYRLPFTQEEVDFAIPFLDEDIPLYMDPFLLWKSPSQQDNALHGSISNSFNYLGRLFSKKESEAISILKEISECDEVGLGNSKTKKGKRIGDKMARSILSTFEEIPQIKENGFTHLELLQLLIDDFSKDRLSDISCNLVKSFLVDYTIQQCTKFSIPTEITEIRYFDNRKLQFIDEQIKLPINPGTQKSILLVPKRWLRFIPWINFDDFFNNYIQISDKIFAGKAVPRAEVLEFNRKNYDQLQNYIERKQLEQKDCKNDPLFNQIPVLSSKRKLISIKKLATGKTNNADQEYEELLCPLLASMLYPELDFAQPQSRTVEGILIRDLIFYNNTSHNILREIYQKYESKQIVIELKNTKEISTTHINQLNRYLNDEFGKFGIIFTRNKPPQNVFKNTIALWAGQRRCILILDDEDLELMCQVYENKQRKPIDVINKKYVEFIRSCPS